jgi:hypothetical protein
MNLLGNYSSEIIALLENNLINPEEGLHKQYELLEVYGASDIIPETGFVSKQFLNPEFSALKLNQLVNHMAIDLPVYLANESSKVNIMICAMDPLSNHINDDKIGLWNPFSILRNPENYSGSDASNHSFFTPLKNEFNLYITDIYKLYFKHKEKKSNSIPLYTKLKLHTTILKQEIKIVSPQFIITLGNASKNALLGIFKDADSSLIKSKIEGIEVYEINKLEMKIICLPHISGLASGAKNKLLADKNMEGRYVNEKLARLLIRILKI